MITFAILAGGQSLTQEQIDVVEDRGWRIIAIKAAMELTFRRPITCCWAARYQWYEKNLEAAAERCESLITLKPANAKTSDMTALAELRSRYRHLGVKRHQMDYDPETAHVGISADPQVVRGNNSLHQVLSIAPFYAERVVLLGADMHGPRRIDDPSAFHNLRNEVFASEIIPRLETMVEPLARKKVRVINATPRSAITCWPMVPLEEIQ